MSSETGSSAHANSVSLLHAPRMLLMPPTPLEGSVCCGTLVPCHTWKSGRYLKTGYKHQKFQKWFTGCSLHWVCLNGHSFQWINNGRLQRSQKKKKKCCKYPKQNFCHGYREGTKQLFLVGALWADHTRVIKQASYWVSSIPATCLQARPLCSSAMATAGPLPAAGRACLPFRALHSHFSLFSSLPE